MAAVTDLANAAAAVSAGWSKTQVDRGATPASNDKNPALRYRTRFEKAMTGPATTNSGFLAVVEGESNTSAAAADTQALAALNAWRRHRYGGSPGRASGESDSLGSRGGTQTVDLT